MPLNLAETRLSLEGYRIQVIEKLKVMRDPGRAHDLIGEADAVLKASELSKPAQRAFWEALHTDLEVIGEEWTEILGKDAAGSLGTIIATAKMDIERHLGLVST